MQYAGICVFTMCQATVKQIQYEWDCVEIPYAVLQQRIVFKNIIVFCSTLRKKETVYSIRFCLGSVSSEKTRTPHYEIQFKSNAKIWFPWKVFWLKVIWSVARLVVTCRISLSFLTHQICRTNLGLQKALIDFSKQVRAIHCIRLISDKIDL